MNLPDIKFPLMCRIRQAPPAEKIDDIPGAVRDAIAHIDSPSFNYTGLTVGITAGSRGIHAIASILHTLADFVRERGGLPVLIPAMGSHGGATEKGQRAVLAGLGITEKMVGANIINGVEARLIGITLSGIPVYCNASIEKVDRLIVVNRIKSHTDFTGSVESGICKMLAIGLGSHRGAVETHSRALRMGYEEVITDVATHMISKLPITLAMGIIENWKGQTHSVEAMRPHDIIKRERILSTRAKKLMIKLPFHQIDVLVIREMGKEISGTGMDTKVIGRVMILGQKEPETPKIGRIAVLDLTAGSYGNVIGIGLADFTTRRVFEAFNHRTTAINCVTSMGPEQAKLPCILENDLEALQASLWTLGLPDPSQARMVIIQNTAKLEYMDVSSSLLEETRTNDQIEIIGLPETIAFNPSGNLQNIF
jgi:hypothetical protein